MRLVPLTDKDSGRGREKVVIGRAIGGSIDKTGGSDLGNRIRAYTISALDL